MTQEMCNPYDLQVRHVWLELAKKQPAHHLSASNKSHSCSVLVTAQLEQCTTSQTLSRLTELLLGFDPSSSRENGVQHRIFRQSCMVFCLCVKPAQTTLARWCQTGSGHVSQAGCSSFQCLTALQVQAVCHRTKGQHSCKPAHCLILPASLVPQSSWLKLHEEHHRTKAACKTRARKTKSLS